MSASLLFPLQPCSWYYSELAVVEAEEAQYSSSSQCHVNSTVLKKRRSTGVGQPTSTFSNSGPPLSSERVYTTNLQQAGFRLMNLGPSQTLLRTFRSLFQERWPSKSPQEVKRYCVVDGRLTATTLESREDVPAHAFDHSSGYDSKLGFLAKASHKACGNLTEKSLAASEAAAKGSQG